MWASLRFRAKMAHQLADDPVLLELGQRVFTHLVNLYETAVLDVTLFSRGIKIRDYLLPVTGQQSVMLALANAYSELVAFVMQPAFGSLLHAYQI